MTDRNSTEEQDIARLLQAAGRREELPKKLKQSWEASFRAELAPVIQRRRRRRYGGVLALCASIALIALLGLFTSLPGTAPGTKIMIAGVIGDARVTGPAGGETTARSRQELEVGAELATAARAYLALNHGKYDLRLNSDSRIRIEADGVRLLRGEIYVNGETGRVAAAPMRVHTRFATVRDIGTQFRVAISEQEMISTVRKGSIVVNTTDTEHTADAAGGPHRVVVNQASELSSSDVAAQSWDWIYRLSPPFQLEGSSAYDFLRWSVAESGRRLVFASDSAETYARITTLHGSVSSLDPEQAVAPVLATTHLRASQDDANALLVSLLPRGG